MTLIPLPAELTAPISDRAARLAREDVTRRGWSGRSSGAIHPFPAEGRIGLRTSLPHVMYQNRGIRPFIMWWVEGRVVPITDEEGTHFVRGHEPGRPGWVYIRGRRIWRDQKWRHPGLAPKNFLEDALTRSVGESRNEIQQYMLRTLGGEETG